MASAMPLIISSLTLHPNLFQEFHPMGGVRARFAETAVCSCAEESETRKVAMRQNARVKRLIFMRNVLSEDVGCGYGFGLEHSRRQFTNDSSRVGLKK